MAESILRERYFDKEENGDFLEDWEGLSRRVAHEIARQDSKYGLRYDEEKEKYFNAINDLDWLPNTPTLMNAGSRGGLGLLSACFVQIPDDSLDSIYEHVWYSAKLFQAGAGVGYNFSNLRGDEEYVKTSMRNSSGAISFMKHAFNSTGEVVKQGGRRRAAMMGLLNADHPQIEQFIEFKNDDGDRNPLENFNISIFTPDSFMEAVQNDEDWTLINRTNGNTKIIRARELFEHMVANNWRMAEPGMIFSDSINRHNPLLKTRGRIHCVNPCGEATLYNFENCCLGSVNLANHISGNQVNWDKLNDTVRLGTRFLDNVVDANVHVNDKFKNASLDTRRTGLGVTGFSNMLVSLGMYYGSPSSIAFAEELGTFINEVAFNESQNIAKIKGPYPAWEGSWHQENGFMPRSVSGIALAPEGTRSLISDTDSSIEPAMGREIVRTGAGIGSGTWKHRQADDDNFRTAKEVPLYDHIKMQAAWQRAVNLNMFGQAISKTNIAPNSITEGEMADAYMTAWEMGVKGYTMYRDGSRDGVYYDASDGKERDEKGRLVDITNDEPTIFDENGEKVQVCVLGSGCEG